VIRDKSLALIVVDLNDEDNVMVYSVNIDVMNDKIFFTHSDIKPLEITDWQERIQVVSEELKDILCESDYSLTLSIENLPSDENVENYLNTGLKWQDDK